VRSTPDSDLTVAFTIAADPADPTHTILLSLTGAQTRLLQDGDGFDVASVTPVARTWIIVDALRVRKDYSYV
jgi:hypothetical protein